MTSEELFEGLRPDMIARDCAEAMSNPKIKEFISLVDKTAGTDVLKYSDFQDTPFVTFWTNAVISVQEETDFRFLFFGTGLVSLHGRELTGKYLADMELVTTEALIRQLNSDVIANRERIYSSGQLDVMNKDFHKWWHVKIPLERNGIVDATLTYVDFM